MWLALRSRIAPNVWAAEGERMIATAVRMIEIWDEEAKGGVDDGE